MSARTFEELSSSVNQHKFLNDVESLLRLADELDSLRIPQATAVANSARGWVSYLRGDYQLALEHYGMTLSCYQEVADRAGVASAIGNMGIVYVKLGDYPSALEHYNEALVAYNELSDRKGSASVFANMGIVYGRMGEYPSALEYHSKALAMSLELGDHAMAANVTGNIGDAYEAIGDYPSALEHFQRALAMHESLDNHANWALITGNIGVVYQRTGDYPAALIHLRLALARNEELGIRDRVALFTDHLGNVCFESGDYTSALEHYSRSLSLYDELGDRASVVQVTGNVVAALIQLQQYDEASELLSRQASMQMDHPAVRARHYANYALLAEQADRLDAARQYLLEAVAIATAAGRRASSAMYHEMLRDLAFKENDLHGYVKHNNEYARITEEINGRATTQKLAMIESQKRIDAERAEKEKHRALLFNTLPAMIADRVLRGEDVNDDHDHAIVMFLDLVGFTTMSASMSSNEVVQLLNNIFTACDAIISDHDMIKIKTIGDSYMAVVLPSSEQRVASSEQRVASSEQRVASSEQRVASSEQRVAIAACALLRLISDRFPQIRVRIGIHSGPVTAGVIGTQRLQYDVWGDTVNIASRMESSSEPGRIHVSEAFATVLRSVSDPAPYTLTPRGMVEIKGKGAMTTYWLEDTST